jgi:hypothetical protein
MTAESLARHLRIAETDEHRARLAVDTHRTTVLSPAHQHHDTLTQRYVQTVAKSNRLRQQLAALRRERVA